MKTLSNSIEGDHVPDSRGRTRLEIPTGKPARTMVEGELQLRLWRPREFFHDGDFGSRMMTFCIDADDGRTVAVGEFKEWRYKQERDDPEQWDPALEEFVYHADGLSRSDYEAAAIVYGHFHESELSENPFYYGDIVIFDRLRIEAASLAESRAAWALVNGLIATELGRRISLIVLKSFPLDYEGDGDEGSDRFKARLAAMQRLYAHRLGAKKLPGASGREGWMWLGLRAKHLAPARRIAR